MNFFVFLSGAGDAVAESGDLPWRHYIQYSHENSNFFASRMLTRFEMPGDDGAVHGSYHTVRSIDSNGKVQWTLVDKNKESEKSYKMVGLDVSLATRLAEDPFSPFDTPSSIELLGNESIEHTNWSILRFRTRLKRSEISIVAKVWVHPETGRPRKIDGEIERLPMPGVKRLSFSVDYGPFDSEIALPRHIKIHYDISLFFRSGVVDFAQELTGWEQR